MEYRFYQPIHIRYNDLDPQGHVNNAAYLVYLEEARVGYLHNLGLLQVESFLDIGIIVANISVAFKKPVLYHQQLRIGTRVTHLGNKSMKLEHSFEDETGSLFAAGTVVLVTFDYRTGQSIPIPAEWRMAIGTFESLSNGEDLPH